MKKKNAGKPVATVRNDDNTISHIIFENRARVTPLSQVINMTEGDLTKGVRVNQTSGGREYLQDIPDSSKADNLLNLPVKKGRKRS